MFQLISTGCYELNNRLWINIYAKLFFLNYFFFKYSKFLYQIFLKFHGQRRALHEASL